MGNERVKPSCCFFLSLIISVFQPFYSLKGFTGIDDVEYFLLRQVKTQPPVDRIMMPVSGAKDHPLYAIRCLIPTNKNGVPLLTITKCFMLSILPVTIETAALTFASNSRSEMDNGREHIEPIWPGQADRMSTYFLIVIFGIYTSNGKPTLRFLANTDVLFRGKYSELTCPCVKL